jgi:deazaflavin-dependent oxidoreductase (nitroreductase family)
VATVRITGTLPGWLRYTNRIVRGLSRLGISTGAVHVLTVPGRKSGKPRSTPVSPLTVEADRYLVAALPRSDWALNVRAAGQGQLSHGRRRNQVTITEVTDSDLRRAVMRSFPQQLPGGVSMFVRLGLVRGGDPEEFAAAADQVAIFRVS